MPKIIHYRHKCIGCGICADQQPQFWRMSTRDGKATLLNAIIKKDIHILEINMAQSQASYTIATTCPVKIIKLR